MRLRASVSSHCVCLQQSGGHRGTPGDAGGHECALFCTQLAGRRAAVRWLRTAAKHISDDDTKQGGHTRRGRCDTPPAGPPNTEAELSNSPRVLLPFRPPQMSIFTRPQNVPRGGRILPTVSIKRCGNPLL